MNQDISIDKRNKLINKFKRSIMLIIDERSMISNELLGACEFHMKKTVYGGLLEDYDFGGIPIVLILGDDYQLPPVVTRSRGKGAFYVFHKDHISKYDKDCMLHESQGIKLFKLLATNVMEITHRTRHQNDDEMIQILQDIEKGEPTNNTINKMLELDLTNLPQEKQDEVKKNPHTFLLFMMIRIDIISKKQKNFVQKKIHLPFYIVKNR